MLCPETHVCNVDVFNFGIVIDSMVLKIQGDSIHNFLDTLRVRKQTRDTF